MPAPHRILMLVTSHGDIHGVPTTGIWFTEFSEPFQAFLDAGASIRRRQSAWRPRTGGPARYYGDAPINLYLIPV